MGEVFKEFVDKVPAIIREAAQSPLALASLIVLVLGGVVAYLFRNTAGRQQLLAFAMIIVGLLGLFAFASNLPKPNNHESGQAKPDIPAPVPMEIDNSERKPGTSEAQPEQLTKEKTEQIRKQAAAKLADGERLRLAGQNDQARAAYSDALAFFNQVDDRLGEANALAGLGHLESKLGRRDQARAAYGEALALFKLEHNRLGQANVLGGVGELDRTLSRNDQARAAYGEALALFKQEYNSLGQANVLRGLGALESMLGRNDQARAAYGDAAAARPMCFSASANRTQAQPQRSGPRILWRRNRLLQAGG
jgi:tetratricopeptide (TPR) repeat protein